MAQYRLPYKGKVARFQIPDSFQVTVLECPPPPETPVDVLQMVRERIGSKHLVPLLKSRVDIVVVLPDMRSRFPFDKILPTLLERIEQFRERHARVTLLAGNEGMLPPDEPSVKAALGAEIYDKYDVAIHRDDPRHNVYLGDARAREVPSYLDQALFYADCIIVCGAVEPHPALGYTGGWSPVAIGVGGRLTVKALRQPRLLTEPGVAFARTWNNPLQWLVRRVGSSVNVHYAVQAVMGADNDIVDVFTGDVPRAFFGAVKKADSMFRRPVPAAFDAAVIGVPARHDRTLATALRGAVTLALADPAALKPGAPILLPVFIESGMGTSPEDVALTQWLRRGRGAILEAAKREDQGLLEVAGSRAYEIARLLKRHPVILVASSLGKDSEAYGCYAARNMPEGFRLVDELGGNPRQLLFLEDPFTLIPSVGRAEAPVEGSEADLDAGPAPVAAAAPQDDFLAPLPVPPPLPEPVVPPQPQPVAAKPETTSAPRAEPAYSRDEPVRAEPGRADFERAPLPRSEDTDDRSDESMASYAGYTTENDAAGAAADDEASSVSPDAEEFAAQADSGAASLPSAETPPAPEAPRPHGRRPRPLKRHAYMRRPQRRD